MTWALIGAVLVSFAVGAVLLLGGAVTSRGGGQADLRWRAMAGWISVGGQVGAFVLTLLVLASFRSGGAMEVSAEWFTVGSYEAAFTLQADGLQSLMAATVAAISLLVHLFSIGYMGADRDRVLYFAELSLFSGAMILLVLAGNLVLLYLGWELVGAASYLLISYYFERPAAAAAGKKAFLVTRTGDIGFLLAIFALGGIVGSLDLDEVLSHVGTVGLPGGWAVAIPLLILAGAAGKSAQFPLHVWLPDAMEGPTPVSALIHAATMVAAGIYLVARLFPLFAASDAALTVAAWMGGVTALGAAGAALTQHDIKRVLAYSTISQLGFMMAALGAAAPRAAIFHLFTHAWFKALLFLCAGSVIHATGRQTVERLGGLRRTMPVTTWTFVIGAVSLAGLPPLAGFFSKEEILAGVAAEQPVVAVILILAAFLTALYALRLALLTFFGVSREEGAVPREGLVAGQSSEVHESGPTMVLPMVLLALGAIAAGVVGVASLGEVLFTHIEGSFPLEGAHVEGIWLPALAILVTVLGIAAAWLLYGGSRGIEGDRILRNRLGRYYAWPAEGYRLDALYSRIVVGPILRTSHVLKTEVDATVIDGAVDGVARLVSTAGRKTRGLQSGALRDYIAGTVVGLLVLAVILWSAL